MLVGEVKTVWSCISEGFDFAGDTVMFLAIKSDAESPIQNIRARVTPVVIPAYISFSTSAFISAVSFPIRGYFAVVQLRQRRRDVSELGATETYLQQLTKKIEDGERKIKMARPPLAHTPTLLLAHPGAHTMHAYTRARARARTHPHPHTHTHTPPHTPPQARERACAHTHRQEPTCWARCAGGAWSLARVMRGRPDGLHCNLFLRAEVRHVRFAGVLAVSAAASSVASAGV